MLSKPRLKMRFTMIELLAVITITAILLTMTMKVMKTDSTKSNATVIGSALKYAQSYALSKCASTDNFGDGGSVGSDGFADQYVKVEVVKTTGQLTVTVTSQDTAFDEIILLEERLAAGSEIDSDIMLGFRQDGSPLKDTNSANTQTTLDAQKTITITDQRNSSLTQIVKLKPFTGKVTYY